MSKEVSMESGDVNKIEVTISDVASRDNMEIALKYLGNKKDACGTDGMFISDLPDYWKINGSKLIRSILEGTYTPGTVRNFDMVNYQGKKRSLSLFNSIDRLVIRAVHQVLQPACEPLLNDHCYSFRDGFGVERAVTDVADYIQNGAKWMVKLDIEKYFDNITLSIMESRITRLLDDGRLISLIQKLLYPKVDDEGRLIHKRKGLLQGSPLSPLLSNLYLTPLDDMLESKGYAFARFGDDITICCIDRKEAEEAFKLVKNTINEIYRLEINQIKSGVFEALGQTYLGYSFIRENKSRQVVALKNQRNRDIVSSGWYRDSVQKIDRNYHLINDGVITKRDYTLLFDSEEGKKYLPVEVTNSISAYSNITFSSDFFSFVNDHKVSVDIVDKYGNQVGMFTGAKSGSRGRTMIKQAKLYLDQGRRLSIAKSLETAYLHNVFSNLKYYNRRIKSSKIEEELEHEKQYLDKINGSSDIDDLMLTEARFRQNYYSMFNEIIHDPDYEFKQRTKRPPKDPINAMISFGNTVLYNRLATEICKTSLDIRIGLVHSTNNRSQTLNLDLADLFKPILIDRTIFTLVNRRMLKLDRDFIETEDDGIYFSTIGKRIFLSEFNKKLYQKLNDNGTSKNYAIRLREEVQKAYRMVINGEKYKPYKY